MSGGELELLNRAHRLFAGPTEQVTVEAGTADYDALLQRAAARNTGAGQGNYRLALARSRDALRSAAGADAAVADVIAAAHHDHAGARQQTGQLVREARADTAAPDTALAQRELMRRRAARLRAQHAHVRAAQQRARRLRATLRRLRYRIPHGRRRIRMPPANSRAGLAVRAALSRLGRPYVWGASGPHQFDCSGLTQWSYAQAGIALDRTTYEQIHQGVPVPRAAVRPGDLVFPNPDHVQLAIGHNQVVEAPHPGAAVQISPLGAHVQIRRPG